MSRSNPTQNISHPCTRWFEWAGDKGVVRYYDKESKKNVEVGSNFKFIFLDSLSGVTGWHEKSQSGIVSNEVRDAKKDVMEVRSFKGGPLVTGIYSQIKEKVAFLGGYFATNIYIAYKGASGLEIGSLRLGGAALNSWIEFQKRNRMLLLEKAVRITGFEEGTKGKIVFRTPKFELEDATPESNAKSIELDKVLQKYLEQYLKKPVDEQHTTAQPDAPSDYDQEPLPEEPPATASETANPDDF